MVTVLGGDAPDTLADVAGPIDLVFLDGWKDLCLVNGQVEVSAGGQLKVPAPRGCSAWFAGATSSGSGLFHPVGIAVGDDEVAVVQQPVEHADGYLTTP